MNDDRMSILRGQTPDWRRREVAEKFRELADKIEQSQDAPLGVVFQIYWQSSNVTHAERIFEGANYFVIAGALLSRANKIAEQGRVIG